MPTKRSANSGPVPSPSHHATTTPGYWLSIKQVCELLGISRDTLNKWRSKPSCGFPKGKRLPNAQVRFVRDEVADWIDSLDQAA